MTNTNLFTASYLDESRFGHASGGSRLRPDLRLFVLHAAASHDRQSHSGDNNKRLHESSPIGKKPIRAFLDA
jgi:hypothetical protein